MTFEELEDLLAGGDLLVNPAEFHGILCGRISTGERLSKPDFDRLLIELLDISPDLLDEVGKEFYGLYEVCLGQIQHQGFDFSPLLPDDDFPLSERTLSLSEWCQGYLFGLGAAGTDLQTTDIQDIAEVLEDLTAFAKLRGEDADDDDESSYMELVEYIRVAVLLVHAHLAQREVGVGPVLH